MLSQSFALEAACSARIAEPRLGRGVERDGHFHIERLGGRQFDFFRAGHEREIVRQAVLVDQTHGFPRRHQGESERELRADRIAIRPDVADQDKRLVVAQNFADLLEAGVFGSDIDFAHGVEPRRGGRILPANPFRARINLFIIPDSLASAAGMNIVTT